jgi:hypothetical protein
MVMIAIGIKSCYGSYPLILIPSQLFCASRFLTFIVLGLVLN